MHSGKKILAITNLLLWKELETEEEVEEHLLKWCVLHFGQSRDTPLATQDWRDKLRPDNVANVVKAIREGRFQPPRGAPPVMT